MKEFQKVREIYTFKKEELVDILASDEMTFYNEILPYAFQVRKKYLGNKVWIRGIIEFSNYCLRNCLYCGLRRENKNLKRYRMSIEEILTCAKKIIDTGIKTIVLQSGDDFFYKKEDICKIINLIKSYDKTVAITLSIGERPTEDYIHFYQAGADRYLLKHETSNPNLYKILHPGQSFEKRKEILLFLKKLGYQVGAGNIVGLPGQTLEDLADDIIFMTELDVDMAGIGPFIPQSNTPLGGYKKGDELLTLKVLALTRILTKNTHLPATTALISQTESKIEALKKSFLVGADVVMISFTPDEYRENYKIYDNRKKIFLKEIEIATKEIGLEISFDRGDSFKRCIQHQKV
jgi:biotin synthase